MVRSFYNAGFLEPDFQGWSTVSGWRTPEPPSTSLRETNQVLSLYTTGPDIATVTHPVIKLKLYQNYQTKAGICRTTPFVFGEVVDYG